jgi:hypothetical protein
MTYTVVWKPSHESQLAAIWNAAGGDRSEVSSAANAIDTLLRINPETRGESRDGATRILVVPPLAVTFEVRPADRLVAVLAVRRLPDRTA